VEWTFAAVFFVLGARVDPGALERDDRIHFLRPEKLEPKNPPTAKLARSTIIELLFA
jgi:hypothetical protein